MGKRGAQISRQRYTGSEDMALLAIVKDSKRANWAKVAKALHERGFPQRTPKSVRNRSLRQRKARSGVKQQQKNLMRVFALPRHSPVLRACLKDGRTRPPVNEGMAFSNDRADDASRWLAGCVALKIEASHL